MKQKVLAYLGEPAVYPFPLLVTLNFGKYENICFSCKITLDQVRKVPFSPFSIFSTLRQLLLTSAPVVPSDSSFCVTGHSLIHLTLFAAHWVLDNVLDCTETRMNVRDQCTGNYCVTRQSCAEWALKTQTEGCSIQEGSSVEGVCERTLSANVRSVFSTSTSLSPPRYLGFP